MRALFYTLGCKVNQYETQAMMRCMADNGYETGEYLPGSPDAGDAVIELNSCPVTGESDRKLRQLLRRCRRENPRAVLVLTGCLPQAFPEEAEGFAEADVVLGNAARAALPTKLPTTMESTLLYRFCSRYPTKTGMEKISSCFQGRPYNISTFLLFLKLHLSSSQSRFSAGCQPSNCFMAGFSSTRTGILWYR